MLIAAAISAAAYVLFAAFAGRFATNTRAVPVQTGSPGEVAYDPRHVSARVSIVASGPQ